MSALTSPLPSAGGALIASPSSALREQVLLRLNGRCRPVHQAHGGADALVQLEKGTWQVLYLDRRLQDLDVEELIAIIRSRFPGTQLVMLDSDAAPEGTPCDKGESSSGAEVLAWQESASCKERKDRNCSPETTSYEPLLGMIGASEQMRKVYRLVRLVAPRNTTVLVAGPTGSGKELIARALHALSPRAAKPLVVVNCAAIPDALVESELFGYVRGAFTGAVQPQLGRIAAAQGGTLFLDEVSELPLAMQGKLLRFLEQKEIQRLGAGDTMRIDVRVVAASNVDLATLAGTRKFREDLFYRLSAFPIELPSLAERRADIASLAEHFITGMAAAMNAPRPKLSAEALRLLEAHSWKGNVRELQHVIERASILAEAGDTLLPEHLHFSYVQRNPVELMRSEA
ncbi:MAG TPA: sigma-54 dependent transcriptional regulator [Candidatus Sulfotelmatobacter sp.]